LKYTHNTVLSAFALLPSRAPRLVRRAFAQKPSSLSHTHYAIIVVVVVVVVVVVAKEAFKRTSPFKREKKAHEAATARKKPIDRRKKCAQFNNDDTRNKSFPKTVSPRT